MYTRAMPMSGEGTQLLCTLEEYRGRNREHSCCAHFSYTKVYKGSTAAVHNTAIPGPRNGAQLLYKLG